VVFVKPPAEDGTLDMVCIRAFVAEHCAKAIARENLAFDHARCASTGWKQKFDQMVLCLYIEHTGDFGREQQGKQALEFCARRGFDTGGLHAGQNLIERCLDGLRSKREIRRPVLGTQRGDGMGDLWMRPRGFGVDGITGASAGGALGFPEKLLGFAGAQFGLGELARPGDRVEIALCPTRLPGPLVLEKTLPGIAELVVGEHAGRSLGGGCSGRFWRCRPLSVRWVGMYTM
jgi:hypothetical protein